MMRFARGEPASDLSDLLLALFTYWTLGVNGTNKNLGVGEFYIVLQYRNEIKGFRRSNMRSLYSIYIHTF